MVISAVFVLLVDFNGWVYLCIGTFIVGVMWCYCVVVYEGIVCPAHICGCEER